MKVLVTGGNGYIGSHTITQILKNTDFEVVSIDNYSRSKEGTMDRIRKITGKNVYNYNVDICDKPKFFEIIEKEKPNAIIHFAAFKSVPESVDFPQLYYYNNMISTINVLEACKKYEIQYLVFSSSCSIYGDIKELPVSEDTKIGKAMCPYAHTKQLCESIIESTCQFDNSLKAISLRYFNPVGADMSGLNGELSLEKPNNLMPIIMETGIGLRESMTVYGNDYDTRDGSCIRDYVHVLDIADAHIKALEYLLHENQKNNYSVFNLGSGKGVSVLEMLDAFEKVVGHKCNYIIGNRRPGDVPAIYSNCSKAEQILNWKCKYSLKDMINSAWLWEKNKTTICQDDKQ